MKDLTEKEIKEMLKRLGIQTDTEFRDCLAEYRGYYSDAEKDRPAAGNSPPDPQEFNE